MLNFSALSHRATIFLVAALAFFIAPAGACSIVGGNSGTVSGTTAYCNDEYSCPHATIQGCKRVECGSSYSCYLATIDSSMVADDVAVVCSKYGSCAEAKIKGAKTVDCSSSDSCLDAVIDSSGGADSVLECSGENGCRRASIGATTGFQTVNCVGHASCRDASMNANGVTGSKLECSGTWSCASDMGHTVVNGFAAIICMGDFACSNWQDLDGGQVTCSGHHSCSDFEQISPDCVDCVTSSSCYDLGLWDLPSMAYQATGLFGPLCPSSVPSSVPSSSPSSIPTAFPSSVPTSAPSSVPTAVPSSAPSSAPTQSPTLSSPPSQSPTIASGCTIDGVDQGKSSITCNRFRPCQGKTIRGCDLIVCDQNNSACKGTRIYGFNTLLCLGSESCRDAIIDGEEGEGRVTCGNTAACFNASIRSNDVSCSRFRSCTEATLDSIGNTQPTYITCGGEAGCYNATIGAINGYQKTYCGGSDSCQLAALHQNQVTNAELECSGSNACQETAVNGISTILCSGLTACTRLEGMDGGPYIVTCSGPSSCSEFGKLIPDCVHCLTSLSCHSFYFFYPRIYYAAGSYGRLCPISAAPSISPTTAISAPPSSIPSAPPTPQPSPSPTVSGSSSVAPSPTPTTNLSGGPSFSPTKSPTSNPSTGPTGSPSETPSTGPTGSPSEKPSTAPTGSPIEKPSMAPTGSPSETPSLRFQPSGRPSSSPSSSPVPPCCPTRYWADYLGRMRCSRQDDNDCCTVCMSTFDAEWGHRKTLQQHAFDNSGVRRMLRVTAGDFAEK